MLETWASHALGDFIAFCDGDDVAGEHWLQALADAAPCADIVGGANLSWLPTENEVRSQPHRAAPDCLPLKHGFLLGIPGGNCGVWVDVAKSLGWDDRFTFGGSDIEFSWRVQLAGCSIRYAPAATMNTRLPGDPGTLARKWYQYGRSGGQLYRSFRYLGMPRSSVLGAAKEWAWLLVHVANLRRADEARRHWIRRVSYRFGRLAGSVRHRVLFV